MAGSTNVSLVVLNSFSAILQIANTMFHVLPSWLSQDVRELLSSSLHANYNTRCTAERAKELVRHSTAGCECVGVRVGVEGGCGGWE